MAEVMLVLHDVSPQSWEDYKPFVDAVDALGDVRMTLLVVPDFHHHNHVHNFPAFRRMMDLRLARGDELALHGFYHADDGPMPHTPRDYFMRRVYTWEGEFYGLSEADAQTRLEAGLDVFARNDWPVHGFVAPAWLMSEGTRQALKRLPLAYTSDPQHLYRLPDFAQVSAPGLVWSARSAWRRGLSKVISDWRQQQWQQAPCIRLGLHPVDMRHGYSRDYWLQTLVSLLEQGRVPMTKFAWLQHQAQQRRAA
ncbi:polysaccharide deacetylase family protein [Pseudomonas silvicola]|nr:polysaccharide deacetylase family protein [Pseudomonas silvicola]